MIPIAECYSTDSRGFITIIAPAVAGIVNICLLRVLATLAATTVTMIIIYPVRMGLRVYPSCRTSNSLPIPGSVLIRFQFNR